jgi:hypothetical protein
MDYLKRKGVASHVGDIAPMAENINIPKEEKGDGKSRNSSNCCTTTNNGW